MRGERTAGLRVDHLLGVAVVGGHERRPSDLPHHLHDPLQVPVHRFDRLDRRRENARVPHHVPVGEVEDHQGVLSRGDLGHGALPDLVRAHLGLEVVGGHGRRRDQDPRLPGVDRLLPAVEEVRDVGVLFRLGDPEVRETRVGQRPREDVVEPLRREGRGKPERLVVDGHAGVGEGKPLGAREAVERLLRQRPGDLARAVGPEVEEDHRVAGGDPSDRPAVPHDHHGLDELVGLPRRVRRGDGGHGVTEGPPLPADHRLVRALDAVPPVVAVHRVVPPDDGRHLPGADLGRLRQQGAEVVDPALRRGVPPVEHGMEEHLRDAALLRHPQQRVKVRVKGVHAAVGEQAHEVQRLPVSPRRVHGGAKDGVPEEVAGPGRTSRCGRGPGTPRVPPPG